MIPQQLGQSIIMSRLLILQSKRLVMSSYQRRLEERGGQEATRERLEQLRKEIQSAQHHYRSAVLTWDSPENHDYWLTAYSRLIDIGRHVIAEMREAAVVLATAERHEVVADVEGLERMVGGWLRAMRQTMVASAS